MGLVKSLGYAKSCRYKVTQIAGSLSKTSSKLENVLVGLQGVLLAAIPLKILKFLKSPLKIL